MKKQYEKPMLCAETFYLTEHIATCEADAAGKPTFHYGQSNCYYSMNNGDYQLFKDGMDCNPVNIGGYIEIEFPYDNLVIDCYTAFGSGISGMFSS